MSKYKQVTQEQANLPSQNISDPPIWGIKFNGNWWVDDGGIVFHTVFFVVAKVQAEILSKNAPLQATFVVEPLK